MAHKLNGRYSTAAAPVPIYPVVDVACETRSRLEHNTFLQTDIVKYTMGELYADGNLSDPIVSPLREKDFTGLAPAYIITAEFDPLRDEGETYAHKLRAAGVSTFYHCYENMYHGFFFFLAHCLMSPNCQISM